MAVNTAGTYRLADATIEIDVDGTPQTIECAATMLGLAADENTVDHPRTGCAKPRTETIDATYTFTVNYMHGYGLDGIHTIFEALAGQKVKWAINTSGAVLSVDFPRFEFEGQVPYLDPLPDTEFGEYAAGDFSLEVDGDYTKTVSEAVAAKAKK